MPSERAAKAASGAKGWAPYVLVALLIWLAWQIVVALLVQRAPVEAAIRVAPGSPAVLSRAAEAEFVAGRNDQARDLAELALRSSPFDVRALRVLGLAIAKEDEAAADPILTLAGNWSLRDDPSHAWLMTRRLRQGDYVGAFGHADALARRRPELWPGIFRLFTTAAAEDPRAVPALLQRIAAHPPWRNEYLGVLRSDPRGPQVQAAIVLGLNDGPGRLRDPELQLIYRDWLDAGRLPGLIELRRRSGRPAPGLHDGGFDGLPAPAPFGWQLEQNPGVVATLSQDEDRGGILYVETDGFRGQTVASQLLLLPAGAGRLTFRSRVESGVEDSRLRWTLACVESGAPLAQQIVPVSADWRDVSVAYDVPGSGCTAQWLKLETTSGPRRTFIAASFDRVAVFAGGAR
ncbi:MAG TPA: hypothetical protein VGR32_00570 [Brevundimonas sp.]|jgi:tetratricopeptide (TPR) repeat protein|uniref:tetratricopeptide repeat protein n=1 Tax=Brevundimonas sp. TaxID=1871086 RepID=UPI002DF22438|nr:hypothetical protein [Brevundimonas sp.]